MGVKKPSYHYLTGHCDVPSLDIWCHYRVPVDQLPAPKPTSMTNNCLKGMDKQLQKGGKFETMSKGEVCNQKIFFKEPMVEGKRHPVMPVLRFIKDHAHGLCDVKSLDIWCD